MYQQIIDQVTAKILAGDWVSGQSLPSIRELAASSGISVITVKRAYLELELAGVIITQQGRGSFVAESTDKHKALLQAEFEKALELMLANAEKLGLTRRQVQALINKAPFNEPQSQKR
jgi:GntR family transcriptional regulator